MSREIKVDSCFWLLFSGRRRWRAIEARRGRLCASAALRRNFRFSSSEYAARILGHATHVRSNARFRPPDDAAPRAGAPDLDDGRRSSADDDAARYSQASSGAEWTRKRAKPGELRRVESEPISDSAGCAHAEKWNEGHVASSLVEAAAS